LNDGHLMEYGSVIESSIRASSIVAVERLKERMIEKQKQLDQAFSINCVLIDFLLWDLAKLVESGQHSTGRPSAPLPCHRTRSIYY
ncbi:hypothetical protein FRC17_006126, partial [Serendipita sp. 399]